MRTLRTKLLRDLWMLKGQIAAIAVVIAAGVMVLILSVTSRDVLLLSQARFYEESRFAEVFAELKRAPEGLATRLGEISGVDQVETRVKSAIRLEVPGDAEPVRGLLLSIPDGRQPGLNQLFLRSGALPDPARTDQVLISEPFAEAHALEIGASVRAIINGRLQTLTVSGVALSPEFIYQVGPADLLPDAARYGVFWMNRSALARALDLDGAFNSVLLSLQAGAAEEDVIDALDWALARYGGIGAAGRDDQVSHRFLTEEIAQLRVMAIVLPAIFLAVAAFLLNLLMARLIQTQQTEIAILKAFGYTHREIALHYALFTGVIVVLGALLGILLGGWAAEGMAALYTEYYRFPRTDFRLQHQVIALGVLVAAVAAALGTARAVWRTLRLTPAAAMRPPAPETFHASWLERSWLGRRLGQPNRIILRNLVRHRLKALLSVIGIALSGSLLLLGSYQFNAIDHLLDIQYRLVMRMDVQLVFTDPTPEHALGSVQALPGVLYAEGFRQVPVRLIHGHRSERTSLLGLEAEPRLRGLLDAAQRPVRLPPEGLMLTRFLAEDLGLALGDELALEIMEGHRRTLRVTLAGLIDEPIGVSAYMERRALNHLLGEGPALSGVWLRTDPSARAQLFARLWEAPRIASIGLIADAERQFREYIDGTLLVTMGILLVMAGSITLAVVYNNARMAWAERERELATLRVLGFGRAEVAWILIGEIVVLTLFAIPLGWLVGTGFAYLLTQALAMEFVRIPFVVTPQAYAVAAAGVLLATVLAVLAMARRFGRLDLIRALKRIE
ncbi:ABC transporter permease [Thiocapsa imhoffii]|uniref:ABC transporter permease n=1 Tax=Thiocapsa imhoffii TaxID=382777 RepID=A0A9X0WK84_9GAMM|nr:ABC transporter permease [Thiocapsa imhoffii]MBK1646078.1 ABC transporter permease [Thiocapsa imhoffii]